MKKLSFKLSKLSFRNYYLANQFQPKPNPKKLSYEEHITHPATRVQHKEPLKNETVRIGYKYDPPKFLGKQSDIKKVELERLARLGKLKVTFQQLEDDWKKFLSVSEIEKFAKHYGIFDDLFDGAQFSPLVSLTIRFCEESVYHGNVISPQTTLSPPVINYKDHNDRLFTLMMCSLDGNCLKENNEVMHWFTSNIPGSDIEKGDEVFPYLPAIPFRGTGFHRYAVILFHQASKLTYNFRFDPKENYSSRSFKCFDFYSTYQDVITPVGLSFFQCEWDESVTDTIHETLGMKEPSYEFDTPPPYFKPFEEYPLKEDINYYDRYVPGVYARYDYHTMQNGSWDAIWNNHSYRPSNNLDQNRNQVSWRKNEP